MNTFILWLVLQTRFFFILSLVDFLLYFSKDASRRTIRIIIVNNTIIFHTATAFLELLFYHIIVVQKIIPAIQVFHWRKIAKSIQTYSREESWYLLRIEKIYCKKCNNRYNFIMLNSFFPYLYHVLVIDVSPLCAIDQKYEQLKLKVHWHMGCDYYCWVLNEHAAYLVIYYYSKSCSYCHSYC